MRKFVNKAGWLLVTAFFLLIAWATSDDAPHNAQLPFTATASELNITVYNKSDLTFDSLNLILNGIYSVEQIMVDSMGQSEVLYSEFKDKNGEVKPADEKPEILEIYSYDNYDSAKYIGFFDNYLRIRLNE